MNLLTLQGIDKSYPTPYGRADILKQVDVGVEAGSFMVLTGPSGSGKTTLLHIAALLDPPTRGQIRFEGEPVDWKNPAAVRRLRKERVGMIFQNFYLLPHRSALENVIFRCRYLPGRPGDHRERARQLLEELGLERIAHQPARLLSGGEMQRVAIARAMIHEPRLLVADEPTGNLDKAAARDIMEAFQNLNRKGITILLVTHNHGLLPYATHHYHCDGGRIYETAVV